MHGASVMAKSKLVRELAWVLVIKLAALTAIYFAFFATPPRIDASRPFTPDSSFASQR